MTANAMQGDREKCLEAHERLPVQAGQGHRFAGGAGAFASRPPSTTSRRGRHRTLLLAETVGGEALLDVERLEAAANDDPKWCRNWWNFISRKPRT
jgi:hypothetical protein